MTIYDDGQDLTIGDRGREPLPDEGAFLVVDLEQKVEMATELLRAFYIRMLEELAEQAGIDPADRAALHAWLDEEHDTVTAGSPLKPVADVGDVILLLEAISRELAADPMTIEMFAYRVSGFAFLQLPLFCQPGHPDYKDPEPDDDRPMTPEEITEQIAWMQQRLAETTERIDSLVDEIVVIMRDEPATPDRQYRLDELNRRIDMSRRLEDYLRRRIEEPRSEGS